MKEFCFLCYVNGDMAWPHFFNAEGEQDALKHAENEWPYAFQPGRPWWLMEVKSTANSREGLIVSC